MVPDGALDIAVNVLSEQPPAHISHALDAVDEGAANFVLVEVEAGGAVHPALLARDIAVRPSTFPLLPPRFLRVTVREPAAVEQLAVSLEEIL